MVRHRVCLSACLRQQSNEASRHLLSGLELGRGGAGFMSVSQSSKDRLMSVWISLSKA